MLVAFFWQQVTQVLQEVLYITVPVFGIALLGYVYGKLNAGNIDAANRININLFVPALLLYVLTEKIPNLAAAGSIAIAAAIVVLVPGLMVLPIAERLGIPRKALIPAMMFNNSGNLGLPLATLAFGKEYLHLSIIAFVVSSTLHFSLGIWYLSGQLKARDLLLNPVFVATLVGLGMNLWGLHFPTIIKPGLEMLSNVSIPLMLVALGVRLTDIELAHWKSGVIAAILAPITGLLAAWLAIELLGLEGINQQVILLFGVLPPAIMNFLMAERYQQHPQAVASIVAFANLAALISVPLLLIVIL
ncbi:MAG: hypothetical protein RI964_1841 [Pseudomonadota bacterium]|jgi:predicted permease